MKKYNPFEVISPIMIGPSSSHTAGACRIGNAVLNINEGQPFDRVVFRLHGSFASTYKGHGTDMALVAGINGIKPDDPRLRHSFEISRENGLDWEIELTDLGDVHPNSVEMVLYNGDERTLGVTGSSIGGGNIVIVRINDIEVAFKNEYPTLIFKYQEQKGIISHVSNILYEAGHNIETAVTNKEDDEVTLIIELTESITRELYEEIISSKQFDFSKYIDIQEVDHV